MEDHFLYKLRNGQLQNNKGNYRSKKIIEHKKDGNINSDSQKQLSKLLEKVLDFQKNTLTCLEKITVFQDRQSEAMSKIADTLKLLNESTIRKKKTKKKEYESCTLPTESVLSENKSIKQLKTIKKNIHEKGLDPVTERKIFKAVKSMRENNQTWNTIADYLKKENISTLTGNGTWSPNLALYFYKKMLSRSLNS